MDVPLSVPATPLTVAAGQAGCVPLDVAGNAATAAGLVRRAAAEGADLVVLPELFLTGYELDAIVADPGVNTVDGKDPRLDELAVACAETRAAVVAGAATRDPGTGTPRISVVVLGRDGRPAGQYDKQHLDAAERAAGFTAGRSGVTLALDGWRLGLGICWDSSFPEHARAAVLDGCHAYLVSAMFSRERGARKLATLGPARALDNFCYVAMANHTGPSGTLAGCARSGVWNPDGTQLAGAGTADPGVATARLDPDALASARAQDLTLTDPSLTATVHPRASVTLD